MDYTVEVLTEEIANRNQTIAKLEAQVTHLQHLLETRDDEVIEAHRILDALPVAPLPNRRLAVRLLGYLMGAKR